MLKQFSFFSKTKQKSFLFILATLGDFAEHAQFLLNFYYWAILLKKVHILLNPNSSFFFG
jgi:hypothetical protein